MNDVASKPQAPTSDRRVRSRARRKDCRRTYRVDAAEAASEVLFESFGLSISDAQIHASASAVWGLLLEIDGLATRRNMRLANVLLSLAAELRTTPADEV